MPLSICSSCLSRLRVSINAQKRPSIPSSIQYRAPFHSSSTQYANPVRKKGSLVATKHRESTSVRIKRKQRERPRPPAVGERKAARKRIVLSNTNALEIPEMQNLSVDSMADATMIGTVLGLEGQLLDQLRDAKAFKTTQNWKMFRRPATLIRTESVQLAQDFNNITETSNDQHNADGRSIRKIITGEKHSGKSTILQQAMCLAFLKKWVVINIPEGQDFTINQSPYAPLPQKEASQTEQLYIQPQLTADLLSRAAYANNEVLKNLSLNHTHPKSLPIKKNMSLNELALLGAQDPDLSWPIWQALWKELTIPSSNTDPKTTRPPILIAIDGFDHWMGPTRYRSAAYDIIHAHQFTLIRQFISLLFSNNKSNTNKDFIGMLLASTSGSNTPSFPTFNLLLRQLEAQAKGTSQTDQSFPMPTSYSNPDSRVLDLLNQSPQNLPQLMTLKGLSRFESRGLLQYLANSGIMPITTGLTDSFVAEKWTLSSGGNIGELEKMGMRLLV